MKLPQQLIDAHSNTNRVPLILLLEGVRFGDKSKLYWMGVYLAYIPIQDNKFGVEYIPYSISILLSESDRYNARRISKRWAVLGVLPIVEIIR